MCNKNHEIFFIFLKFSNHDQFCRGWEKRATWSFSAWFCRHNCTIAWFNFVNWWIQPFLSHESQTSAWNVIKPNKYELIFIRQVRWLDPSQKLLNQQWWMIANGREHQDWKVSEVERWWRVDGVQIRESRRWKKIRPGRLILWLDPSIFPGRCHFRKWIWRFYGRW